MIRLSELKLPLAELPVEHRRAADAPTETEDDRQPPPHPVAALTALAATALGIDAAQIAQLHVFKRSFDARKADLLAVYIVLRRATAIGKRMALEQYRTSLHEQRKQFGHDAFSRSAAASADADLKARSAPARTREEIRKLREKQVEAEKAQRQVQEDFERIKGA